MNDDNATTPGWWTAKTRKPTKAELDTECLHCGETIRAHEYVKQCPACGLLLHASCYEDTAGGRAARTEGCDSCLGRCHWR